MNHLETSNMQPDLKPNLKSTKQGYLKNKLVKNISPKNTKKRSMNAKGTPELHRFFKKMKEKQEMRKKNNNGE